MVPFRSLRQLLSRAHDEWIEAVETLFQRPKTPPGPRPLRVMRLERRRVLSADFTLTGSSLVLDGFDSLGGDTLAVTQNEDSYRFTSAAGWNTPDGGPLPTGVSIDGATLSVDRGVLDALHGGLTVSDRDTTPLDVRLGDVDFSGLSGPLTFDGPASIGQLQPFAQVTAPVEGMRIASASAGTVVTSINVSGDLSVISFGKITDMPGTEIVVTGNATFISRVANQPGDFDADGDVDDGPMNTDRIRWTAGYGITTGASRYDGDANGDGAVDAADYSLWRDSLGETSSGGIELADSAADRLIIGGVATFDADEAQGVHPVDIGRGGHTEFGSVRAYGSQVAIFEDASSAGEPTAVIDQISAFNLSYTAAGKITDTPTAQIAVLGDATFVVTSAALIPDSTTGIVQAIELANEGGDNRFEVGGVATFVVEPQTSTDAAFDQRKGVDVGVDSTGAAAPATFNAGSLRFSAPLASVRIAEDSSTMFAAWTGASLPGGGTAPSESTALVLQLVSAGDIEDSPAARLNLSTFGTRATSTATLIASGKIALADGGAENSFTVGGRANFIAGAGQSIDVGVDGTGLRAGSSFSAGQIQFFAAGGNVRIAEDGDFFASLWSDVELPPGVTVPAVNTAQNLEIDAAGGMTVFSTQVVEDATFVAAGGVVLSNGVSIGDLATFVSASASNAGIDATYTAGRTRYRATVGGVRLTEADGTLVADWATDPVAPNVPTPTPTINASRTLEVRSGGSIEDSPTAKISATDDALFVAEQDIRLANEGLANSLTVGDLATFISGTGASRRVDVGVNSTGAPADATFTAGRYRFASPEGTVAIAEDNDTIFANWSLAPTVPNPLPNVNVAGAAALRSAGSVTDGSNHRMRIDRALTVVAGGSIDLADSSGDELTVGTTATLIAGAGSPIDLGVNDAGAPGAFFIAGSLRFSSPGEAAAGQVRVFESSGTELAGWTDGPIAILGTTTKPDSSRAASLDLRSNGPITDAAAARVITTGDARFTVTNDGANLAADPTVIVLANDDAVGTINELTVGGVATFVVDQPANTLSPKGIDVGVNTAGAPALARFNAGSIAFSTPGAVAIAEDSATEFAGVLPVNLARSLSLRSSGAVTDAPASVVSIGTDSLVLGSSITLVDAAAENRFEVVGQASFATTGPRGGSIFVGADATGSPAAGVFNAGSIRFDAGALIARFAEDTDTVLGSWAGADIPIFADLLEPAFNEAFQFEVRSAGSITDTPTSDTRVGPATLIAAAEIVLADGDASNRFESTGLSTFMAGSGQRIDLGVNSGGAPAAALFNTGSLRFAAPGGAVRISEDSAAAIATWQGADIPLLGATPEPTANVAASLDLVAAGRITDVATAQTVITGNATFTVVPGTSIIEPTAIVLADDNAAGSLNRLEVGGLARFVVDPAVTQPGRGIDVGVVPTTGGPANATFLAGSLGFSAPGGVVRIAEDDASHVTAGMSVAGSLGLHSAGSITDADTALVAVVGDATLHAAEDIRIVDQGPTNFFSAGDVATFLAGHGRDLEVGVTSTGSAAAGTFAAGSLRYFVPNGEARIAEDDGMLLAGWPMGASVAVIPIPVIMASESQTLEIAAVGIIEDAADAVVLVTGRTPEGMRVLDPTANATFVTRSQIKLADGESDANKLIVDGLVTFSLDGVLAPSLRVGTRFDMLGEPVVSAAEFVAGSVRFIAPNARVAIAEDASATFKGTTFAENPGTQLAAWDVGAISPLVPGTPTQSAARELTLWSAGRISDAATAKVFVTDNASFVVTSLDGVTQSNGIELADAGAANRLEVGGLASFVLPNQALSPAKGIDVGVVPATGAPAAAFFDAGSLGFMAQGATVRIAEDGAVVLGAVSSASDGLEILADGSITDEAAADVAIAGFAQLSADGGVEDIVLGDASASFRMGSPALFSPDEYLALDARNVSIQADSAVNLRTTAGPLGNLASTSHFDGVFFLQAAGSVSQLSEASPTPLSAQRVAVSSDNGAVLLRRLELRATDGAPNLQVSAGGAVGLATTASGDTVKSRFADNPIPALSSPNFVPVRVEGDNAAGDRVTRPRAKDAAFEDLLVNDGGGQRNAQLFETRDDGTDSVTLAPTTQPFDLPYSAIVVVTGDAVVGDVRDPSTSAARLVDNKEARGVTVTNAGAAYLQTIAGGNITFTNRGREGDASLDATVVHMAGGVFTAIAAGTLRIDTEQPAQQSAVHRTTKLTSATGTVTSVGHGAAAGPRAALDPSTEEATAATTGLVRADQDFEQRLTLAVGSRGENNVLVEVEWADVATIRPGSQANARQLLNPMRPLNEVTPGLAGSSQFPDLTQAPVGAIEDPAGSDPSQTGLVYQELGGQFRVATIRHNYSREFVPVNPAQNTLPTTVRIYNDPSINLYEAGGAVDLNSASFVIAPRIITLPPSGFFIISEPDLPRVYEPTVVTLPSSQPASAPQLANADVGRAVVSSSAEKVVYGRVDDEGKFIKDIPGEDWPQPHEDAEGDFLREVRELIDEGPFSAGRYQVKVVTPRSEQVLEEWNKGVPDSEQAAEEGSLPANKLPDSAPPENAGPAVEEAEAVPAEVLPVAPPVLTPESRQGGPLGALGATFATVAAVGGWRRRFETAGPFTLTEDGVTFTRSGRHRRRLGGPAAS